MFNIMFFGIVSKGPKINFKNSKIKKFGSIYLNMDTFCLWFDNAKQKSGVGMASYVLDLVSNKDFPAEVNVTHFPCFFFSSFVL